MTIKAIITIKFTDWWLSGTGRAGVGDVDAVPHTDRYGCPALPMTQVKGQLRETAVRLAKAGAGGWTKDRVFDLFGGEGRIQVGGTVDEVIDPGALAFRGDATIEPEAARWLAENSKARRMLTKRIASTRIGPLGAAEDQALRAVEAVVPMTLTGEVRLVDEEKLKLILNWIELLDAACAATLAFGKLKTDGYGRAIASCGAAP